MAKQPLTINGTGAQTRDFIFVKDLVEALIACMNKPLKGFNLFQIASGTETSINDLRDEIANMLASRSKCSTKPQFHCISW